MRSLRATVALLLVTTILYAGVSCGYVDIPKQIADEPTEESIEALLEFFEQGKEAEPIPENSFLDYVVDVAVSEINRIPKTKGGGLILTPGGFVLTASPDLNVDYDGVNISVYHKGRALFSARPVNDPEHGIYLLYAGTGEPAGASEMPIYDGELTTGQNARILFIYGEEIYFRDAKVGETGLNLEWKGRDGFVKDVFELIGNELPEKTVSGFVLIGNEGEGYKLAGIIVGGGEFKKGLLGEVRKTPIAVSIEHAENLALNYAD